MPNVEGFFHQGTSTISYLVADEASGRAAIVDPVLDYDHPSGSFSTHSADKILARAEAKRLTIEWILETHAHADHLTAAQYLKTKARAPVAIGEHIRTVQSTFSSIFNLTDLSCKGSEFDRLLADGERFRIGGLSVEVLHTPGHTPACVSYRWGQRIRRRYAVHAGLRHRARRFSGGQREHAVSVNPAPPESAGRDPGVLRFTAASQA